MSATSLKLPETLKAKVVALAAAEGKSTQAWMLDALAAQTTMAERRSEFVAAALAAEQEVAREGQVFEATEVFAYLNDKIAGRPTKKPRARRLIRS